MDFALTDDQIMIRDAAATFLADASGSAAVRAAIARDDGFDPEVWRKVGAELGWCATPVAEAHGGLGLGAAEVVLILEQMGRHLFCAPFFSTVCLAANLLQRVGSDAAQSRLLPRIADGSLRITTTLPSQVDWLDAAARVHAHGNGSGWILDGQARRLPDGRTADRFLLLARTDNGSVGLFEVPRDAAGVRVVSASTWDATRQFADVELQSVRVPPESRCDQASRLPDGITRAAALARLYVAAEQLGGAQQCLDLTVAYGATRKQFGRTIGSFQAVKHRCAEMMVRIEALRSAVYGAATLAANDVPAEVLSVEGAMVKSLASDTFFHCAQEAIQLHGGVGFTWEFDPQLYFKRAQASSHWLGTSDALRAVIAEALLEGRAAAGDSRSDNVASPDDAFRAEVAAWMRAHLTGRFAGLKHRGGPGDEEFETVLRKDWERELAAGGWTCVGWPKQWGGRELSIDQQVIFHEEYARAGGPGRMGHIGVGLLGPTLLRFGSEEQKRRFLPGIANGTEFWCQGYSEPGAGSDLANVQTKCWQEADGSWRVQGQKIWTSNAQDSDWIFVLARCEPGSKGHQGLAFLLLPLKQPGIEIRPIRQMGGGAEFNEVFFDGARAEKNHIVGAPGDGWKVAMGLLEAERGVSTLGQQMHFAHELDLVIKAAHANGSVRNPRIRDRIALAWGGLRVMRYNALRMLSGPDAGLRREALIYKYYWSNWHRDLGKLAMDVLGPAGDAITDDADIRPLQQMFFFSRADTIYAGTNEIQLNVIAERGLGMPKEPRPINP